ncbi:MAG: thioredoxin family protein [Thermoplasmata archaeon]|nr:thioredoxin family protein [Thermoplasmata archaeon]
MLRKVDSGTLDQEVIAGGKDALVLFHGDWCSDCRAFRPTWDRWARKLKGAVYELEVGKASPEWSEWDLKEIPTVALFIRGAEEDRAEGTISAGDLDRLLKLWNEEG